MAACFKVKEGESSERVRETVERLRERVGFPLTHSQKHAFLELAKEIEAKQMGEKMRGLL